MDKGTIIQNKSITNKVRLCEPVGEPQSEPFVGQARYSI